MRRTHKGISPCQGWQHVLSPKFRPYPQVSSDLTKAGILQSLYHMVCIYSYINVLPEKFNMFLSSTIFPVSFFSLYTQYFWSQTDCAVSLQMPLIITTSMAL